MSRVAGVLALAIPAVAILAVGISSVLRIENAVPFLHLFGGGS